MANYCSPTDFLHCTYARVPIGFRPDSRDFGMFSD